MSLTRRLPVNIEEALEKGDNKIDLLTILPSNFLDIPYNTNQHEKKKKLVEFTCSLEKLIDESIQVDYSKDYTYIYNIVTLTIEEANHLLSNEGLKALKSLIRLMKNSFPPNKMKHYIILMTERLKTNMKGLNPQISSLLEDVLINRCFALENFLDLLLTQAENSRKLTTQIGCMEWIEQNFLINFPELLGSLQCTSEPLTKLNSNTGNNMTKSMSMMNLGKKNSSGNSSAQNKNSLKCAVPKNLPDVRKPPGAKFLAVEFITTRIKALLFKEKTNQKFKESCTKVLNRISEIHESQKPSNDQNKENEGQNNPMKNKENFKKIDEIETLDGSYSELSQSIEVKEERSRGLTERNHHSTDSIDPKDRKDNIYEEDISPMMCAIKRDLDTLRRVWLNANNTSLFAQKSEAFLELLESIDNEQIQNSQDFLVIEFTKFSEILKYSAANTNSGHIDEKINDFVLECLIRSNKKIIELSPKNLSRQIKWVVYKNNTGRSFKKSEQLLDTAYMTCSLEVFLKETMYFLEKLSQSAYWMKSVTDRMIWNLTHYAIWLAAKIEKAQNYILNDKYIQNCENFFSTFGVVNKAPQFIESLKPICEALLRKINLKVNNFFDQSKIMQLTQSSERSNNFQTPKSRRSNSYYTFNTNILNTVESYIHERSFKNELKLIEGDIDSGGNSTQALERIRHLLDSARKYKQNTSGVICSNFSKPNSPHHNIVSPNRHWKRGMGRDSPGKQANGSNGMEESKVMGSNNPLNVPTFTDLKGITEKICEQVDSIKLGELFETLNEIKLYVGGQFDFFLKLIFGKICTVGHLFNTPKKKEKLFAFMEGFFKGLNLRVILEAYRDSIHFLTKKESTIVPCINLIKTAFAFILTNVLLENISLNVLPFLIETMIFCLHQEELYSLGCDLMHRIYKHHDPETLQKIFENELVNSFSLYQIYITWVSENIQKLPGQEKDVINKRQESFGSNVKLINSRSEPSLSMQISQHSNREEVMEELQDKVNELNYQIEQSCIASHRVHSVLADQSGSQKKANNHSNATPSTVKSQEKVCLTVSQSNSVRKELSIHNSPIQHNNEKRNLFDSSTFEPVLRSLNITIGTQEKQNMEGNKFEDFLKAQTAIYYQNGGYGSQANLGFDNEFLGIEKQADIFERSTFQQKLELVDKNKNEKFKEKMVIQSLSSPERSEFLSGNQPENFSFKVKTDSAKTQQPEPLLKGGKLKQAEAQDTQRKAADHPTPTAKGGIAPTANGGMTSTANGGVISPNNAAKVLSNAGSRLNRYVSLQENESKIRKDNSESSKDSSSLQHQRMKVLRNNGNSKERNTGNSKERNGNSKERNSNSAKKKHQHIDENSNYSEDGKWKSLYEEEIKKHRKTLELLEKVNCEYLKEMAVMDNQKDELEKVKAEKQKLEQECRTIREENIEMKKKLEELTIKKPTEPARKSPPVLPKEDMTKSTITKNDSELYQEGLGLRSQVVQINENALKLREIFLTADSHYSNILEKFILHYENLRSINDKLSFIMDVKQAVFDEKMLQNLSDANFKIVINLVLKLCTSANTQVEIQLDKDSKKFNENELTRELQLILDVLLRCRNSTSVVNALIKILSETLNIDFSIEMSKNEKMLFRLILKCVERFRVSFGEAEEEDPSVNNFEVLLEIYKFFKRHPPESLEEDLPSIKEFEFIFRSLKKFSDTMVDIGLKKAQDFIEFVDQNDKKSIFLKYLQNYIERKKSLGSRDQTLSESSLPKE